MTFIVQNHEKNKRRQTSDWTKPQSSVFPLCFSLVFRFTLIKWIQQISRETHQFILFFLIFTTGHQMVIIEKHEFINNMHIAGKKISLSINNFYAKCYTKSTKCSKKKACWKYSLIKIIYIFRFFFEISTMVDFL